MYHVYTSDPICVDTCIIASNESSAPFDQEENKKKNNCGEDSEDKSKFFQSLFMYSHTLTTERIQFDLLNDSSLLEWNSEIILPPPECIS